jgi:hypothetical protein
LLYRIPFRHDDGEQWVLVCILLEHQSAPDPRMPLRLLLYAVLYWEREWKAWEDHHEEGESLRLSPILPLVFHTGPRPWGTNRTMADLLRMPEALRPFAPEWQVVFWNLSGQTSEALRQASGAFVQALAVLRSDRDDLTTFLETWRRVTQGWEALHDSEPIRWYDLMRFVIAWALWRRPQHEREQVRAAIQASQPDPARHQEVRAMSESMAMTWGEEMQQKVAQARVEGVLRSRQEDVRVILQRRFGPLPEALIQRIEKTEDHERLKACILQAMTMNSLEELQL